jgi:UDP-N-acetyl-D-mannosaminuronic acid transferase (WecB/TagA/CpsF family)
MSVDLLGISVTNVGQREAIKRTNEYLKKGGLNTIAYLSAGKVVQASENEDQKHWWSDLDLILWEDTDVLEAAGVSSQSRIREVEENAYLKEFLRTLVKNHAGTFLLADTEENLQAFEEELRFLQNNLYVVGREATDHYPDSKDGMVNAINALAPRVILSRLPYPEGIRLMHDYRMYLNSSVWLTLPEKILKDSKESWVVRMTRFVDKKILHRKMNNIKETKND